MRRRIDITEVEAATKIRAKYLRALENEEWDLLPGPTFVKTFLRTYAEYLGLDARQLVEEYSQRYERPSTQELTPFAARPRRPRRAAPARPRAARPGARGRGSCVVLLLGALYVLGTAGADDEDAGARARPGHRDADGRRRREGQEVAKKPAAPTRVAAPDRGPPGPSTSASSTAPARR